METLEEGVEWAVAALWQVSLLAAGWYVVRRCGDPRAAGVAAAGLGVAFVATIGLSVRLHDRLMEAGLLPTWESQTAAWEWLLDVHDYGQPAGFGLVILAALVGRRPAPREAHPGDLG